MSTTGNDDSDVRQLAVEVAAHIDSWGDRLEGRIDALEQEAQADRARADDRFRALASQVDLVARTVAPADARPVADVSTSDHRQPLAAAAACLGSRGWVGLVIAATAFALALLLLAATVATERGVDVPAVLRAASGADDQSDPEPTPPQE